MIKRLNKYLTTFVLMVATATVACGVADNVFSGTTSRLNVVVIDPGHGGKDFGTSVGSIREKDIVLDIGLKLGAYIHEAYPGIKIIYTRNKDVFVPLHKRAQAANDAKADLFISIHANYVGVKTVSGTETFVLGHHRSKENLEIAKKENSVILLEDNYNTTYEGFDPNSSESYIMFEMIQDEYLEQSLQLASFVQGQFKSKAKRRDRGVKQAGFLVLRETTMPSVLIETGFISNDTERKYVSSEAGKSSLAYAIFEAFNVYKNIVEDRSSFNLNLEENSTIQESSLPVAPENKKEEKTVEVKQLPDNAGKIIKQEETGSEIIFRIQVAASTNKLNTNSPFFKNEKGVAEIKSGKRYKYYIGNFKSYSLAAVGKERLRKKFSGAFVVAFEDGKPISIKDAIEKTKK